MALTKQTARKRTGGSGPRAVLKAKKLKRQQQQTINDDSSDDEETKFAARPTEVAKLVDVPIESDSNESTQDSTPFPAKPTKLKRDRNEFDTDERPAPSPPAKKKKYKSKEERNAASLAETEQGGAGDNFDPALAQMDPSLLADHFAKTIKRFYKNDTTLELEERYLPGSTFTDTSQSTAERKKSALGVYLESTVAGDKSKLTTDAQEKASPHTVMICTSGIRGADLARELRTYETDGNKVSKLFAKHFKITQQADFLSETQVGFGVGTPFRLQKLIESGALKTDRLARLVVDGSYLDGKGRGFWQIGEVFKPMLEMLKMKQLQERIESGDLKVIVF